MKKRILALALVLALALSGCAKKPAQTQQPEPPEADGTKIAAPADTVLEVVNNGGNYVSVGGKVYFRRYGADALWKRTVFGEFTGPWNAANGMSTLMAYDPAAGTVETVCRESGTGALWYGDGGFYLRERMAGGDYVTWCALDGTDVRTLCAGEPLGVTDSGLLAVKSQASGPSYAWDFTFYREQKPVGELRGVEENYTFAGLTDDGLFLLLQGDAGADGADTVYQLTPTGKLLLLGALPATTEEGPYYVVEVNRFAAADGKVELGVGYYAGTGYFLGEFVFAEADVGQEGSLRAVETDVEGEDGGLPRLAVDGDGGISLVPVLDGELFADWETGDLQVFENGSWKVLAEELCPALGDGFGYRRIVQDMDYIDSAAYVTLASALAAPADSVGWRDAYALLGMRYLEVKPDGTIRELACVDHDDVLYGDVWFIEGESMALWRQRSDSSEEEYFVPECAYLIPIADDAEWVGGWESVFDGSTGLLPYDYGEGEARYYGLPVPDVEPAGQLCLKLDDDGNIVRLARKAPNALLNVDFDVPQTELDGAVETLALKRRENDEDTPWFWTKLRALEDGVRVRVERTPAYMSDMDYIAIFEGAFPVGETVYEGTLNEGEFLALRASMPWLPELRVSVSRDGAWGSYIFGEDNYLHLETAEGGYPALTLGAYPMQDTWYDGLGKAICGTWVYRSPSTGDIENVVTIDPSGELTVGSEVDGYTVEYEMGRLFAESWESPDLLCLRTDDPAVTELVGFGGSVGDYLVELFRTDGEEILHLVQANNGDGALSTLLADGSGAWQYEFTLTRAQGACENGSCLRGMTFPAEAVRFDGQTLWLREARIVEEDPALGTVWSARWNKPCLAYHVTGEEALQTLRACKDSAHPMRFFSVTVDADGTVAKLDGIDG